MTAIIAGGRDYKLTHGDVLWLDSLGITEVIHGDCCGTDYCADAWALERGLPIRRFPADWAQHGRAAGPIRNAEMAKHAEVVVLFPGGRGTESMRREARKAGLKIYESNER